MTIPIAGSAGSGEQKPPDDQENWKGPNYLNQEKEDKKKTKGGEEEKKKKDDDQ